MAFRFCFGPDADSGRTVAQGRFSPVRSGRPEPASSPGGRGLNRSSDASRYCGEHLQRGRVFVEPCPHRFAVSMAACGPYRAPGKRLCARTLSLQRRVGAARRPVVRRSRPACGDSRLGGSQGPNATRGIAPPAFRPASARSEIWRATARHCRRRARGSLAATLTAIARWVSQLNDSRRARVGRGGWVEPTSEHRDQRRN